MTTLKDRRALLINYLKMKIEESDWHGVADAAMDLRELEVRISLASDPILLPVQQGSLIQAQQQDHSLTMQQFLNPAEGLKK